MEVKGFNENAISEQNKEALQSETWQGVRKAMKTEIRHFTDELLKDDPYGYPWEQVVDAYLKSGYKEEDSQYELTVLGSTYKVLKREDVTSFYDADGNTLFDVVNGRLEQEYGWLVNDNAKADSKEGDADVAETKKENANLEKGEANKEVGETQEEKPEKKIVNDVPADNIVPLDPAAIKQIAKEKLEKEMKADKDKTFAEPVIGYLLKRCEEDLGLAQDVAQDHKTWKKCFDYIYEQARKQTKGNRAAVRDEVVYEWAEDYYRKDDKAEEEKKAKKAAERKKKEAERKKKAAEKKAAEKDKLKEAEKKKEAEKPTKAQNPKKKPKEMDGQMDLFSMMGM